MLRGMAWQVVCEETPEPYAYGSRSKPKERYVGGIVTPASPNYVHGLVDITGAAPLATPPPLLGIAASVTGYQARLCMHVQSCIGVSFRQCCATLVVPALQPCVVGYYRLHAPLIKCISCAAALHHTTW